MILINDSWLYCTVLLRYFFFLPECQPQREEKEEVLYLDYITWTHKLITLRRVTTANECRLHLSGPLLDGLWTGVIPVLATCWAKCHCDSFTNPTVALSPRGTRLGISRAGFHWRCSRLPGIHLCERWEGLTHKATRILATLSQWHLAHHSIIIGVCPPPFPLTCRNQNQNQKQTTDFH